MEDKNKKNEIENMKVGLFSDEVAELLNSETYKKDKELLKEYYKFVGHQESDSNQEEIEERPKKR